MRDFDTMELPLQLQIQLRRWLLRLIFEAKLQKRSATIVNPFEDCVILVGYDDLTKACCTNCQWMLFTTRERVKNKLCTYAIGSCDLSGLV